MPGAVFKTAAPGALVGSSAAVTAEPVCPSTQRTGVITMAKKSVGSLGEGDLKGKRVFVRVDLNVPLDGKKITDDTRIRATVPTIKYLVEKGAKASRLIESIYRLIDARWMDGVIRPALQAR